MNILVTGGAGYIGSHACKALSENDFLPVTFDNLSHGHSWAVKWGPLVQGELGNTELVVQTIRQHKIEAVMHFAALIEVGASVVAPDLYYANNVGGSLSLLTAMKQTGVKRIVFSSTCATYGLPVVIPMDESHPQNPINPYGTTKLVVERMLADFKSAYGIDSISLRYFNASGAENEAGIGEAHHPESHLIPLAMAALLGQVPQLTLFGTDYDTPDGTCIRDYIHVKDLASAHILALEAVREKRPHLNAYNLGNGTGFSVKQVIECIEKVTGEKVPHTLGPRRTGDPARLISDSKMAIAQLGWKPRLNQLEEIVESAWKWANRSGTNI